MKSQFSNLRIREAVAADAKGIAHVQVDSYLNAYKDLLPPDYLSNFTYEDQEIDWLGWQEDRPQDILLVGEYKDKVIGYSLSRVLVDENGWGEVAALHVLPKFKGYGAGKALFVEAAHRLQAHGCRSVLIWTLAGNPSRGFYEHLRGKQSESRHWIIEELDFDKVEVCYRWTEIMDLF